MFITRPIAISLVYSKLMHDYVVYSKLMHDYVSFTMCVIVTEFSLNIINLLFVMDKYALKILSILNATVSSH